MKLRGIDFGHVMNASGARNFYGEGWPFHHLWNLFTSWLMQLGVHIHLLYLDSTLVTKTTTWDPREGYMPLLQGTTKPVEWLPKCIVVKPFHGVVLNKVGLSGPGAVALVLFEYWQERAEPFIISFMSVGPTREARLGEAANFAELLLEHREEFCAPFAIEINFSCPNVGHEQMGLVEEVREMLELFKLILPETPLIVKFNVQLEPHVAATIAREAYCDAITVSNTIPWGMYPNLIDWERIFGSRESPLAKIGPSGSGGATAVTTASGGGGLSGAPLLPLVVKWIFKARELGIEKPIIACGGILHPRDVRRLKRAGASAVQIGSASILRPWRVQGIINEANRVFECETRPKSHSPTTFTSIFAKMVF